MQGALDRQAGLFGVGLDELGDAVDQGVGDAGRDGLLAPGQVDDPRRALFALVVGRHVHQPLGVGHVCPLRPVQDHVLDGFAQDRVDVVIDG
ncbi:hypothetical protein D3C72_2266110 [compost metagenome]